MGLGQHTSQNSAFIAQQLIFELDLLYSSINYRLTRSFVYLRIQYPHDSRKNYVRQFVYKKPFLQK